MARKNHKMTLGRPNNKTSQIVGTSFTPRHKINLPYFLSSEKTCRYCVPAKSL